MPYGVDYNIYIMHIQELLQSEIERLNATNDIELVFDPGSISEYELINHARQLETYDLDIFATLEALKLLPDNARSSAFWEVVVDTDTKKPSKCLLG